MHTPIAVVLTAALLCPACAPEGAGELEFRDTLGTGSGSGGGTVFNTNEVDDAAVSEVRQPMGLKHKGVTLEGVELASGVDVARFEVEDGELVAYDEEGDKYLGPALYESEWRLRLDVTTWMSPLRLHDRAVIDGWPHYRFRKGILGNTCRGATDDIYARLLTGFTLDEATGEVAPLTDNTYIACRNGATGKAAALGYYDLALALGDFTPFETAIRVIRADYCYDGTSYTHAGVAIEIEDAWSPSTSHVGPIEAVWGPDGLLCRGSGRTTAIPGSCDDGDIPACKPGKGLTSYPGALFLTRVWPVESIGDGT